MGNEVVIAHVKDEELPFGREDLVPPNLNLSLLATITPNQLITLRAKVVKLQKPKNVNHGGRTLQKVTGMLVDPFGCATIVLWGDDCDKVEEGQTYKFTNLRVKKSSYNQGMYVNPAKHDSEITVCQPFEEALAVLDDVPEEFLNATVVGEILGVSDTQLDRCCVKCRKVIQFDADAIGTGSNVSCNNAKCKLTQKVERCGKQWFAKAFMLDSDREGIDLIFRHETIMEVFKLFYPEINTKDLSVEIVLDSLMSLPICKITYKKNGLVVIAIASQC